MNFYKRLEFSLKFVAKSLFFLQYWPAALWYSYKRDRAERRFLPQPTVETPTPPGKLLKAEARERGAYVYFEEAELEIVFLQPDLVRFHWFPGLAPIPYAIANTNWPLVATELESAGDSWNLSSSALKITIGVEGSLQFYRATGELIREELPPQRRGDRWCHQATMRTEECIYGLGERAVSLNLRAAKNSQGQPQIYQMWNYDPNNIYRSGTDPLYICIPVYWGLNTAGSYLIFYENTFRAEFSFSDTATANFHGGALRYYVAIAEPAQLMQRYGQLTGCAPLPPLWALGYHQSRWGYGNEENLRRDLRAFQEQNLPLSAFHLDIDCQVKHRAFTIDPQRFPRLDDFVQELGNAQVKLIAINNPGIQISRQSNLCLQGLILNAFCTYPDGKLVIAPVWPGRTVFPDFTHPRVRAWWSQQFAYLLEIGIAGFWNDMSEPATFSLWGDRTLPQVAQHYLEGRGGDHREAHNIYGLLEARAAHDSIREFQPQHRPFIVSRSGWAGLQRYAWTWTGDIVSTWEALRQTVATVIGLGLSGIPYSGPDIGGFLGNPTAELYLRWFQMAAFMPFCRTHSSISVEPRSPWSFGEPYLGIIRRFLQLRYSLLPYFYTLAWEAAQQGYPLVRPLFWLDWQDSSLWEIEDAFCLGKALLVCPIVEDGARSRSIHLPKGCWYSLWDEAVFEGGQKMEIAAPLETMPVLVRAGSVVPMVEENRLILHLYPLDVGESCSHLYSDAGEGYGESRLDCFRLIRNKDSLELVWEQQGNYAFSYGGIQLQVHGLALTQAWIDGEATLVENRQLNCSNFQRVRFAIG